MINNHATTSLIAAIHHRATVGMTERKGRRLVAALPSSAIHSLHHQNFPSPKIIRIAQVIIRSTQSTLPHIHQVQFFIGFFIDKNLLL